MLLSIIYSIYTTAGHIMDFVTSDNIQNPELIYGCSSPVCTMIRFLDVTDDQRGSKCCK